MNLVWWQWLLIILAALGLAVVVVMQTSWYKVRKYALDVKSIYDKNKLQEKVEAVQALGQNPNPNPMLMKKPLRDLINAYQELIAALEKTKVPAKARTVHDLSLTMHRESLALYQMAAVGGFRQKAMLDRQKKVQQMEKTLQVEMEKLYGKMKEPKKK